MKNKYNYDKERRGLNQHANYNITLWYLREVILHTNYHSQEAARKQYHWFWGGEMAGCTLPFYPVPRGSCYGVLELKRV